MPLVTVVDSKLTIDWVEVRKRLNTVHSAPMQFSTPHNIYKELSDAVLNELETNLSNYKPKQIADLITQLSETSTNRMRQQIFDQAAMDRLVKLQLKRKKWRKPRS